MKKKMNIKNLLFGVKRWGILLRKENESYFQIGKRRLSKDQEEISYKSKQLVIDQNVPNYKDLRNIYYFIDVNGGQLKFKSQNIDPNVFEIHNRITKQQVVDDLSTNLVEKPPLGEKILLILMGLGVGLFIGYLLCQLLIGQGII
jgi:hypothetical protein